MTQKDREKLKRLVNNRVAAPRRQHLKNAILPRRLETRFLADMEIGEKGYTELEAMIVDHSGRCWIILTQPYEHEYFVECLVVTRGEDGFFVDVGDVWDYWRWTRSEVGSDLYAEDEDSYAPVLKIVGIPEKEKNRSEDE